MSRFALPHGGGLASFAALARRLVAREWRHHPWRHAVTLLTVALGVALAWSVHLVNRSALAEFSTAVRGASGTPELVLRGQPGGFDERLYERAAADPEVDAASPVLEVESYAHGADGASLPLRVIGVDAFRVAALAAALRPVPAAGRPPRAVLDPALAFVNAPLRERLGEGGHVEDVSIRAGPAWHRLPVAGDVAAGGTPLVVMDLAGAQTLFGMEGRLTRIDLRPAPGARRPAPIVQRGRALAFPRDHGAHPDSRIEWWYATGWLGTPDTPTHGVQVTFFRSATGLAARERSRFAARHVLFAHAALTDLGAARHRHVQHVARWSGLSDARPDAAALDDARVRLGRWTLVHEQDRWRAQLRERGFALELDARRTQPTLPQGDAGFSRKGPDERQASHYYSEPQLALAARGRVDDRAFAGTGRAWLDHEWSDELLHPEAVGWDWIGMNLFDGAALTAFRLRRADGSALWAGGSLRPAGRADAASFAPQAVRFDALRRWRSAVTNAEYPLDWQLDTPAGRYAVRALLDAQELSGPGTFGAVYWEGLSELLDERGRRVGLGYLEMTGYAARLAFG